MTTTREHRLLELVEKWRSVGPDEEPEYRRPDGVSVYCADELAAILAEPVEVSEEMVVRASNMFGRCKKRGKSQYESIQEALTAALNLKEPGQ